MSETVTLTIGREQIADIVEALRFRASGMRATGEPYEIAELVERADLLDGLADAIVHKAAGQLALRPEDAGPAILAAERSEAQRAAATADPRGERDR